MKTPEKDVGPSINRLLQLDLKHLVAFEALYSTRNLSRAADLIGFAQPTMSNLLARMRDVQGDKLFVRGPGGMMPTARAEEMIASVRTILREVGVITHDEGAFDPSTASREFRLHAIDMFETLLLPALVADFEATPNISFKVLSAPHTAIADALESGRADLALGLPSVNRPDLQWQVLMPIRVVAIARKGNPKIKGPLTAQEFRDLGHVSLDFEPGAMANISVLRPTVRLERRDVVKVTRVGSILELVSRSDLVGVVSRPQLAASPFRDQLQILDVPLPEFNPPFQMTWHKRNASDKALIWLRGRIVGILKETWGEFL